MPKTATCALIWSPKQEAYELRRQGVDLALHVEDRDRFAQAIDDGSFSFQGRHGRLTLRKEARQHGEGYWYAYRNQGRKTLKRYAGRTADLTIAHLEEIAEALNLEAQSEQGIEASEGPLPASEMISQVKKISLETGKRVPNSAHTARAREHTPLLNQKLSLPRLPSTLVARERLLTRLDARLESKLTLLSAPAGFGKTTLARQWIARQGSQEHEPAVAWISLDAGDNDPVRFWNYVIAACQAFDSECGQSALALLHTTEQPLFEQEAFEAPLTLLLNDLGQLSRKSLLVLEDYHVIIAPQIHEALAFLLDHLPATLRMVILTRTDPPFSLTRLRATDELSEFRADDLRFSQEEMRDFLRRTLTLSPGQDLVTRLDANLEGWITGLRLFTLALQGHANEQRLEQQLRTFSGGHRYLLEYFASEVLATQPEEIQMFLLQTSMLHSLAAPLCDALTGRHDSGSILETLEHANLFLSPLDGDERWYRYHPLFAETLRREAGRRLGEDILRACSERAGAWYAQHGRLTEAIEASLAACSFAQAAELIEQFTGPQRFHEMYEHHTLHRWLDALPETILEQHPLLCLTLAMVLLFAADCRASVPAELLAQVERPLRMAERIWQAEEDRGGLGEALAFRAVLARFQGKPDLESRQARQALAWLPENAYQWRATCLGAVGNEALRAGELHAARQTFLEAHTNFAAAGNHYGTRATLLALGEICFLRGELRQAAELYREVLATAGNDLSDRGKALLELARLSYERNDLAKAEQEAREAHDLGQQLADDRLQIHASLILASIQHARGHTALAGQQCAALRARAQIQQEPLLSRELLAWETRFQLAARDLDVAQRSFSLLDRLEKQMTPLQQEQENLLSARLLLEQNQTEEALCLLERTRDIARDQQHTRNEIEALLLIALAHFQQQNLAQAWQRLRETLAPAYVEGYLRLFLDEGDLMADLLHAVLPMSEKKLPESYARSLLLAFAHPYEQPAAPLQFQPFEPLSPQEQRVLSLLVSGASNREIAENLVVSPNTVKTQVQSIYRKLNIHSRKEVRELFREQHQS